MSCFWKHQWGNWSVVEEGKIEKGGRFLIQERACEICEKKELDEQEVHVNVDVYKIQVH